MMRHLRLKRDGTPENAVLLRGAKRDEAPHRVVMPPIVPKQLREEFSAMMSNYGLRGVFFPLTLYAWGTEPADPGVGLSVDLIDSGRRTFSIGEFYGVARGKWYFEATLRNLRMASVQIGWRDAEF